MHRSAESFRKSNRSLEPKPRRQQSSNEHDQRARSDLGISLPLPSFPPPLDFDPELFTLPPPYEEGLDVEKAFQNPRKTFIGDGPNPSPSIALSDISLSKQESTQELYINRPRRCLRIIRFLRYTILTVYRRLFTFVILINLIGVYASLRQRQSSGEAVSIDTLATFASSNLLVAICIRQNWVINILYRTAWLVPWSVPLRIRTMVARVYCFGGTHSGAAVAGTIWWIVFTAVLTWQSCRRDIWTPSALVLAWVAMLILIAIIILAFPNLRARYHNTFELTHRFLGWTTIALFWAQLFCLTHQTCQDSQPPVALGVRLSHTPTFWNLIIITAVLIYPWLRIHRWEFTTHPVSSHAIRLSTPNTVHKFSVLSLSSPPLLEWHPFATFPSFDSEGGCSFVISATGDWTQNVIATAHQSQWISSRLPSEASDSKESRVSDTETSHSSDTKTYVSDDKTSQFLDIKTPPQKDEDTEHVTMQFWVRAHPTPGVLSLTLLFPRVLILTTGSGIGPCLSSLLDRPAHQHVKLVWSTRSPLLTYGAHIRKLVQQADPDALVIDTDREGRPDLLDIGWRLWKDGAFEAVFVLSNQKTTRRIVRSLEGRGVPAFGPIWDS